MGEYADEQFRRELSGRFGFDPGPMNPDDYERINCKKCSKRLGSAQALSDHMRDKHARAQSTPTVGKEG